MAAGDRLTEILDARDPASTAFVFDGGRVSVADFARAADNAAAFLEGQGLRKGDCCAVWLVNRLEWMALLFAAARIGVVIAAVNTRYRSADLAHILAKSGARMLVMEPGFRGIDFPAILREMDAGAAPRLEKLCVLGAGATGDQRWPAVACPDFLQGDAKPATVCDDGDAPLLLFTTSGTTKGPKLVAHSQTTLGRHARDVARGLAIDPARDRLLAMLPFCGTFGMVNVFGAFAGGAPVHVMDTFDPKPALEIMQREKITLGFGSDEMFRRILAETGEPKPFPAARLFGFAAFQPGWRELAAEAQARGMALHGLYGSSEVQALFSIGRSDGPFEERIEGGGKPMSPEARVRVRDLETGELAATGVSGELEIDAPSRFLGYYRDPEATAAAMAPDGFFRTGDIGHLRGDGTFVYETRAGDAMRLAGFLVGPGEIEDELKSLDGVADAQVVAIEIAGQARCAAFVIPRAGATLDEAALIAALRARLAGYKAPARVFFIDAFPVTESANGTKIQRTKLRDMAMSRIA